jgi:hypothetical protein
LCTANGEHSLFLKKALSYLGRLPETDLVHRKKVLSKLCPQLGMLLLPGFMTLYITYSCPEIFWQVAFQLRMGISTGFLYGVGLNERGINTVIEHI